MALQIPGLRIGAAFALLLALTGLARAEVAALQSGAVPLMAGSGSARAAPSGSLFAGTASGSLFAPLPTRARSSAMIPRTLSGSSPVDQLLSLIAQAEAGRDGYDAVQYGARIRPDRPPTQLTLGDIYAWIAATPGQPHAIGRYQFIPATLRRVARIAGLGPEVRFTPQVQDALALVLLDDAGFTAFENGELGRRQFMHGLARIWQACPCPTAGPTTTATPATAPP